MNENELKSLENYKKKFETNPDEFNEFQANDFVKLLKNNNELDEAIEVSKTFLSQSPNLKDYLNQYGYALYNKYINVSDEVINEKPSIFFSILDEILDICKQERYSPVEPAINRVVKYALNQNPIDYQLIIDNYSKLDFNKMSDKPFINNEGREFESRKERSYRLLIRAYYETKDYHNVIEETNKAFASNIKWHYSNLSWIKYYRACALVETGKFDEANREFLSLHGRLKGINFYEVIYKMQSSLNDQKTANKYLLYEFFEKGYDISHLPLYYRLKEATDGTNDNDLMIVVNSFISALCKENNKECALTVDEKYQNILSNDLYDTMYELIMNNLDKYVERKTGKVVYYNESRKIGSISVYDDDSIFFRQADYIYDEEVYNKDTVEYTVLPTYDNKKDTLTSKAILIKTIEDDLPTFNY